MSILIKDMKMPKGCLGCPCINAKYNECMILQRRATDVMTRMTDCPLVQIPDHGDLIERDELMKHEVYMPMPGGNLPVVYTSYVKAAKTVIPAERSEE